MVLSTSPQLLRLPKVMSQTGYSRSSIYKLISEGSFPPPIKLGLRAVAWSSEDIDEWIQTRIRSANKAGA